VTQLTAAPVSYTKFTTMKKIIYALGILVSSFIWGQQKQIPLSGDFGGTRCNGSIGLCSVTHSSENKNPQESKMTAKIINDSSFQLIINLNQINSDEESKIVGSTFSELNKAAPPDFIVEEDFILDQQTATAIGLKTGYIVIPAGNYPLNFDEQKVYITFTLEQL